GVKALPGDIVFRLWDTYGFPFEMTQEMAREQGVEVDVEGFEREMEAQRERGRASAHFGGDRAKIRVYESLGVGATTFLGYERLTASSVVVGVISGGQVVSEVSEGQDAAVVLVADVETVGAAGAVESCSTTRTTSADTLSAASVAVTLKVLRAQLGRMEITEVVMAADGAEPEVIGRKGARLVAAGPEIANAR
ncbi:MAG: hypothetical protein IH798_01770, partial [Gemmatimonadetes bacterium]|nr:hypothetical protein [Gemmatimonadota bacterium]